MKQKTTNKKPKKIVLILLTAIVGLYSLTIPIFASYTGDEIPQNRYLTGCWTPSPRYQVTWTTQTGDYFFGADLDNTYYANDNGTLWGFNDYLTYTGESSEEGTMDTLGVSYFNDGTTQTLTIPETMNMALSDEEIYEVHYKLSSLIGTTKYIDETWIDIFLPEITIYSRNGLTDFTSRNETWSCWVDVIEVEEIPENEQTLQGLRETKNITTVYVSATNRNEFIQNILNPLSLYPNSTTPYDIIGIRALTWEITIDSETIPEEQFDVTIDYQATINGTVYTATDMISEANGNAQIDKTTVETKIETIYETIYNNSLDLSGFMDTIRSMLTVDIIGTLSVMDIMTIVVGVGITIWFLKVFAGG